MTLRTWLSSGAFTAAMALFDRFPCRLTGMVLDAATERFHDDCVRATPMGPTQPVWDCLVGGPELPEGLGEEHAAMVDLHGIDCWPSSRQRTGWEA